MPKNQDTIRGAMQPGRQDGACLLCPRWARPGRVTKLGSRTHFYVLISLLFHRKFNKQVCSGVYKAGSLSGPGSSSQTQAGLGDVLESRALLLVGSQSLVGTHTFEGRGAACRRVGGII